MEDNRKFALIFSYYLSRYDKQALSNLGYRTMRQAYEEVGSFLNVNPNTIKNMRDEFDPMHSNERVGWYQRELKKSRLEVLEKYKNFSEDALTEVVKDILTDYTIDGRLNVNLETYLESIETEEIENNSTSRRYTTRGVTGRKAEELFKDYFQKGDIEGISGTLIDRREDGCGFDFELQGETYVFEIKGLLADRGGISFTDKEWGVAKQIGENYFLVVINNTEGASNLLIIRDPYNSLKSEKNVYKTVAVSWSVDAKQLFE